MDYHQHQCCWCIHPAPKQSSSKTKQNQNINPPCQLLAPPGFQSWTIFQYLWNVKVMGFHYYYPPTTAVRRAISAAHTYIAAQPAPMIEERSKLLVLVWTKCEVLLLAFLLPDVCGAAGAAVFLVVGDVFLVPSSSIYIYQNTSQIAQRRMNPFPAHWKCSSSAMDSQLILFDPRKWCCLVAIPAVVCENPVLVVHRGSPHPFTQPPPATKQEWHTKNTTFQHGAWMHYVQQSSIMC